MTVRVSVVVPVLNMRNTLGECLHALTRQNVPADDYEVIVVDNGSSDGSQQEAARFAVTLLAEARPGAAAARNRGVEAARGDIIAFTDADCVPSRGWLRALLDEFDDAVHLVAGACVPLDGAHSLIARYSASIGQYDATTSLAHPRFPYAPSVNLALRASAVLQVGAFDPRFLTYDAADLCLRLRQAGLLSYRLAPRAVVLYRVRSTLAAFARQNYGYGQGLARYCARHPEAAGWSVARLPVALGHYVTRVWRGRGLVFGSEQPVRERLGLGGLHLVRETALLAGVLSYRRERSEAAASAAHA